MLHRKCEKNRRETFKGSFSVWNDHGREVRVCRGDRASLRFRLVPYGSHLRLRTAPFGTPVLESRSGLVLGFVPTLLAALSGLSSSLLLDAAEIYFPDKCLCDNIERIYLLLH